MSDYQSFLAQKRRMAPEVGSACTPDDVAESLFPFQRALVAWSVRRGRAGLFTSTGSGKSRMMVEFCRLSGRRSLIVAPLAVCQQTAREAAAIGVEAKYVRSDADAPGPGVWITNYEMVQHFDPSLLDVVVLDESAILRDSTGKTRTMLIKHFGHVPRRLTCTATPRPNDAEELTNQAEFLGVMPRPEMLAAYFVHDDDGYRLKGHARKPMFQWMSSWAVALTKPSDLGYSDDGYILPGLDIIPELLPVSIEVDDQLFPTSLGGVGGRAKIRKATLEPRCERAADLVAKDPDQPWLMWTGLNAEADLLAKIIPGAVNVHGSMTPEEKAELLLAFADGQISVMVTKPSLAAHGLNLQVCHAMAFVGLADSYDSYYQAIRRCYRYGQKERVRVHIVLSELEAQIAQNVARKEAEADAFMQELVHAMRQYQPELMSK